MALMRKNPLLFTFGLCSAAALAGAVILHLVASGSSSISDRWLTLCGFLVICAALLGYHLADGRRPAPARERLLYSVVCACVNGVSGLLSFVVLSRAWMGAKVPPDQAGFFYQLTHPWVFGDLTKSIGIYERKVAMGWLGTPLLAFIAGGLICYYGFRHINET